MLSFSRDIILQTTDTSLHAYRRIAEDRKHTSAFNVNPLFISSEGMNELMVALEKDPEGKPTILLIKALLKSRHDSSAKVKSLEGFCNQLTEVLLANMIDGWIYHKADDGRHYPYLFSGVTYSPPGRHSEAHVNIYLKANGRDDERSRDRTSLTSLSIYLAAGEVTHRTISDILTSKNLYMETEELKQEYLDSIAYYEEHVSDFFAEQFIAQGAPFYHSGYNSITVDNVKVIQDLHPDEQMPVIPFSRSPLFEASDEDIQYLDRYPEGNGVLPIHPVVKVFNLESKTFQWFHADALTPYKYQPELREKLILPKTHKDLLDILTTNISVLTGDIIDGKSAGNTIMCKGAPGVGKTLTAEIYSEIIKRPLYSIDTGTLGCTPEKVHEKLKTVLEHAKRWNVVLLLDESDVFVRARGNDIVQNAIVAEFLRTLEYFDGLLFMATNRSKDIDDAILSRCAAIIDYHLPNRSDSKAIWKMLGKQFEVSITDHVLEGVLDLLPNVAPRDIKALLRLVKRFSTYHDKEVSVDMVRQCAMFRGIEMTDEEAA